MSESIQGLPKPSTPIIPGLQPEAYANHKLPEGNLDALAPKSPVGLGQPTLSVENDNKKPLFLTCGYRPGTPAISNASEHLNGVLGQFQGLQGKIQSTSLSLPDLKSPELAHNLQGLNPIEHQASSRALNHASAYLHLSSAALMADPSHAQTVSIGLSEILQLVNELRRTMGETYHADMEGQRTQMMKGYDAKISAMLEAAENDYAAGLARGIGGVVGGTISVIPIVGGAGQIATGAGDIVAAMKQYEADKARAEQTKFEGVIAGAQNRLEEFGKFYDSLKQWVGDMVSNVQKTIEDSESTKQGITRNI